MLRQRILKPFLSTWLTGLLAVLPLVLTLVLVGWVAGILNRFVGPGSPFGRAFTVFGDWFAAHPMLAYLFGTALVLLLVYLLGLLVHFKLAGPLKTLLGNTMRRIPLIGGVYDIAERFVAVFGDRQAADIAAMSPVWCSFGEHGVKVLGLLPNATAVEIDGQPHLTVLVPTAPIPVGGGLLYVPAEWVRPADIGIDTLTSVYLSMGITLPRGRPRMPDVRPS